MHTVSYIRFVKDEMLIAIDSKEFKINLLEVSPKLLSATDIQRNDYEISPGGYGIHWRLLDEDLSINGLIRDAKEG